MIYRRFGRTDWKLSEIGYGMWGMGGWKESNDKQSMDSLNLAVEKGVNFFDTARFKESIDCLSSDSFQPPMPHIP